MSARRSQNSLAVLLVGALCGCGGPGGSSSGGGPVAPQTGGLLTPPVQAMTGHVYLGVKTAPAAGYEMWVFDESAATMNRYLVAADGSFFAPVTDFNEGHLYSLHLVSNDVLIGDIDFGSAAAGVEKTMVYAGGLGFDLGDVTIPVAPHGGPVVATAKLNGSVGGGFTLADDVLGTFGTFPLPTTLTRLSLGSQLIVDDGATLLHSFIDRAAHPDLYGRDLARLSRIGVQADEKTPGAVRRVFAIEGGSWLKTAREPATDSAQPEVSPLWSSTLWNLGRANASQWAASVFSGGLPTNGLIALVQVEPPTGPEQVVPLLVPRLISMPPMLTAMSGVGGTPTAVDYTGAGPDGLTVPLCQSGDVVLQLKPPLDANGAVVPASLLSQITVHFDWYQTANGATVPLTVAAAQLPAPYNAAVSDTNLADVVRSWNAAQATMTAELDATAAAAAEPQIQLWNALFPQTLAGKTVTAVRLSIVFRSPKEATAGGIVVWIKPGC